MKLSLDGATDAAMSVLCGAMGARCVLRKNGRYGRTHNEILHEIGHGASPFVGKRTDAIQRIAGPVRNRREMAKTFLSGVFVGKRTGYR